MKSIAVSLRNLSTLEVFTEEIARDRKRIDYTRFEMRLELDPCGEVENSAGIDKQGRNYENNEFEIWF